ncbi:hypothetical protein HON36_04505 [Candidatus Parcubacteria bacterium]|jgi:hypothetical protein|nr:hypothetical protein [Candidatus Parcubacteria bacterium]MBT7227980.1 hypothetical protein [Candidatus Parcubacteria bacterium]
MEEINCQKLKNDFAILKAVKQQLDDNLEGHTVVGSLDLLRKNIDKQISILQEIFRIIIFNPARELKKKGQIK